MGREGAEGVGMDAARKGWGVSARRCRRWVVRARAEGGVEARTREDARGWRMGRRGTRGRGRVACVCVRVRVRVCVCEYIYIECGD